MIDKMIENMPAKTGKTLGEWIQILQTATNRNAKHKEQVQWLMTSHGLGANYADVVVHKANGSDAGSQDDEALLAQQYVGKETLRPIYDRLMTAVASLGNDVVIAPKKAYVSLRRTKQFACLKPATKNRFELELILKGEPGNDLLERIPGAGAMCTHRIKLSGVEEITEDVLHWLRSAYARA